MSSGRQSSDRRRGGRRDDLPNWNAPPYSAIQTVIGEELKARFEPPGELPYRLLTLLMQMNEETRRAEEIASPRS